MKLNSDALANFFGWIYKTVEAADEPLYLIVVVFLPLIAPIPPSIIVRNSLISHMSFETYLANITAIALIMLGYSSVIAAVRAYTKARKDPKNKVLQEEKRLYMAAWFIYLTALSLVAVILEVQSGASLARVSVLVSLTLGSEISAGILNASRIANRESKDEEKESLLATQAREDLIRRERAENRLKGKALKHGINVFAQDAPQLTQVAQTDAQVAHLSERDAQQVKRFSKVLAVSGNWRVDHKRFTKDDLHWLKVADVHVIMRATGIAKRTAQKWKKDARELLK